MKRRNFLAGSLLGAAGSSRAGIPCGCEFVPQVATGALGSEAFRDVSSGVKITK